MKNLRIYQTSSEFSLRNMFAEACFCASRSSQSIIRFFCGSLFSLLPTWYLPSSTMVHIISICLFHRDIRGVFLFLFQACSEGMLDEGFCVFTTTVGILNLGVRPNFHPDCTYHIV